MEKTDIDHVAQQSRIDKAKAASIVFAVGLFFFDSFYAMEGNISTLVLLITILVLAPFAIFGRRERRRARFVNLSIVLVSCFAVFFSIYANNLLAAKRANELIIAIESYKLKYNKYPEKLEYIAPEFVPLIPVARYALSSNKFKYIYNGDNAAIIYISFRPSLIGLPLVHSYNFLVKTWGQRD